MLAERPKSKPQIASLDGRSQVEALKAKSLMGLSWESRRQDPGQQHTGGFRPGARKTCSRGGGLSRCDSAPTDEEVTLLLDTLEELSEVQEALCSQVVKLAASCS